MENEKKITKYDVEIKKIDLEMKRATEKAKIIKCLALRISYCIITGIICYTVYRMNSFSAAQILAFANVVASSNITFSISFVLNLGLVTSWVINYKGKKRIIKKAGALQKQVETEPNRTSSGLSPVGSHPDDE